MVFLKEKPKSEGGKIFFTRLYNLRFLINYSHLLPYLKEPRHQLHFLNYINLTISVLSFFSLLYIIKCLFQKLTDYPRKGV